jgi:hypothetical protein
MRKILLTMAALAAFVLLPSVFADRANAMTNPLPAGIANAVQDLNAVQEARYVCRRVCNWRGCWRRCGWVGPRRHWRRW